MGVYAQTNFDICCDSNKVAEEVAKKLKEMKEDENGNTFGEQIEVGGDVVYGFLSSNRIQNLEWRCERIWDEIKGIDGIISANFPFLSEADGIYFEK